MDTHFEGDTMQVAQQLKITEARVWNGRKSTDDIRTPRDATRALCEEIIWWHNQLYGHGITLEDLQGQSRFSPIVACRADCMRRLREVRKWSYPTIGKWFGGRDHTTVMHHVEKRVIANHKFNISNRPLSELRERRILAKKRRGQAMAGLTSEGVQHT